VLPEQHRSSKILTLTPGGSAWTVLIGLGAAWDGTLGTVAALAFGAAWLLAIGSVPARSWMICVAMAAQIIQDPRGSGNVWCRWGKLIVVPHF